MAMVDHALALARRGLKVFQLKAGGKKPVEDMWPFFATTDEAYIRQLWARPGFEDCNPAVATSGMVVVDVDVKNGKPGYTSYADNGGHFDTFTVRTPSGGSHCYFHGPNSGLRVDLFPGVDIRSHNGYVVGPGAVIDGRAYEVSVELPFAELPAPIAGLLRPPRDRASAPTDVDLDAGTAVATARAWLEQEAPAVQGAGGDDRTYRVAARLVRDFALSKETAFLLLEEAWNPRCSPPWDRDELWAKVQNASEYATGAHGQALPASHLGSVQIVPPLVSAPQIILPADRGIRLGNLLEPGMIKERPWRVHRFAIAGEVTTLTGAGAGGKGVHVNTAAAHFAVGQDFGPWKLVRSGEPMRSVVYDAEDDIEEQSRRVQAICMQYGFEYTQVRQNLATFSEKDCDLQLAYGDKNNVKENEDGIAFITQLIKDCGAELAFIGPLVNLHGLNENDAVHMRVLMSILKRISRDTGAAIIISHHTNKDSGARVKNDPNASRGSGAIINSSRIALMLSKLASDELDQLAIPLEDRARYGRIDDAKANVYLQAGGALMYTKLESVRIPAGSSMPVPVIQDHAAMSQAKEREAMHIATLLASMMKQEGTAKVSTADACKLVSRVDDLFAKTPVSTQRARLQSYLGRGVVTPEGIIGMSGTDVILS